MKNSTLRLAFSAVIAAAYVVLTVAFSPISYGAVQFRISEALCILPFFMPGTAAGLFFGCILANLFTGNVVDIIFGSLATLLSCISCAALGRHEKGLRQKLLACGAVTVINAVIVGFIITKAYNGIAPAEHPELLALNMLQVGLGEAAVMFIIGLPLMLYLPKKKFFTEYVCHVNGGRDKV